MAKSDGDDSRSGGPLGPGNLIHRGEEIELEAVDGELELDDIGPIAGEDPLASVSCVSPPDSASRDDEPNEYERATREVELPASDPDVLDDEPLAPVELGELDLASHDELEYGEPVPWQEAPAAKDVQGFAPARVDESGDPWGQHPPHALRDRQPSAADSAPTSTAGAYFVTRPTTERVAIKSPIAATRPQATDRQNTPKSSEGRATSTSLEAIVPTRAERDDLSEGGVFADLRGVAVEWDGLGQSEALRCDEAHDEGDPIYQLDTNPGLHAADTRPGAGTDDTLDAVANELRHEAQQRAGELVEDDFRALAEAMDEVAAKLARSRAPGHDHVPSPTVHEMSPPGDQQVRPGGGLAGSGEPLSRAAVPLPPPRPIAENEVDLPPPRRDLGDAGVAGPTAVQSNGRRGWAAARTTGPNRPASRAQSRPTAGQGRVGDSPAVQRGDRPSSQAIEPRSDETPLSRLPSRIEAGRYVAVEAPPSAGVEATVDSAVPHRLVTGSRSAAEDGRYDTPSLVPPRPLELESGRYDTPDLTALQHAVLPLQATDSSSVRGSIRHDSGLETVPAGPATPLVRLDTSAFDLDLTDASGVQLELAEDPALLPLRTAGTVYEGPVADELSEPTVDENSPAIVAVREFFGAFEKALRVFNLYEGRGDSARRALDAAAEQLLAVLGRHGEFTVRVTPYELIMGQTAVFTNDEERRGITYRLFRDGVRELSFRNGVTAQELTALIDVVRLSPDVRDEDDSVTRLWEKNLTGIEYRATDTFLEGMIDASTSQIQQQIDRLVEAAMAPRYRRGDLAQVPDSAAARLDAGLVREIAQLRDLAQTDSLASPLRGMLPDIWRRVLLLASHLSTTGQDNAAILNLLGRLLEQLLERERWEMLAAAALAIERLLEGPFAGREVLDAALAPLCVGDRLLALVEPLEEASVELFGQLMTLLTLLPPAANDVLVRLLSRMKRAELQDEMATMLAERGLDLVDYHRQRLKSSEHKVVLMAIEALSEIAGPNAVSALREAASHTDSRVQIAALQALDGKLERADSALAALLSSSNGRVRELTLAVLEPTTPDATAAGQLHDLVANEAFDGWKALQIKRVRQLVVRWGGSRLDDLVIKTLTASNPFRRKRIEQRRQEMFEAVQRVGGERGRQLLEASLDRKLPDAIRSSIELALARMK